MKPIEGEDAGGRKDVQQVARELLQTILSWYRKAYIFTGTNEMVVNHNICVISDALNSGGLGFIEETLKSERAEADRLREENEKLKENKLTHFGCTLLDDQSKRINELEHELISTREALAKERERREKYESRFERLRSFVSKQKQLPLEFSEIINENFFDMLSEQSTPRKI